MLDLAADEWIGPGSFGFASAVFAATRWMRS